jgi:hypothetical protein
MAEKDMNPREKYRNDPDPRKRFADVFINGEPVVTPPLDALDDEPQQAPKAADGLDDVEKFLQQSRRARPMRPEDRLGEGESVAIFGKHIRPKKRSS